MGHGCAYQDLSATDSLSHMTDNAEGGSNSHAITPQEVDQEGGAIEGGGVRGRAIVSQIGSWKVMST